MRLRCEKFGDQFFLQGFGQSQGQGEGGDRGNSMGNVKIPERSKLERSREILEELYRRSRDKNRTSEEKEYLERLLEEF